MKAILSSDSPVVLFIMFFRIGSSEFCQPVDEIVFQLQDTFYFVRQEKKNIKFNKPKFGMKSSIVLLMAKV